MNLLRRALTRQNFGLTNDSFDSLLGAYAYSGRPLDGQFEIATANLDEITERVFKRSGPVWTLISIRMFLFAEARFQWQKMRNGRPGDLFGTTDLELLERPWPNGGTTSKLLKQMLLDVDIMGNAYVTDRNPGRLKRLRPDWVYTIWGSELEPELHGDAIDGELLAYVYMPRVPGAYGAETSVVNEWNILEPSQVAHFAPYPDPQAFGRGMSWLTPLIREIEADNDALKHKASFFKNGAMPRLAMKIDPSVKKEQFERLVEAMEQKHAGSLNAYKTLYVGGGADPVPLTFSMKDLDYHAITGLGETRLASASGVPTTIAGFSEGLQGSSLNKGNFDSTKRRLEDLTARPLWRDVCESLETLFPPPAGARLWYDSRDISFLRDDTNTEAEVTSKRAATVRQLVDAGFEPDAAIAAANTGDLTQLAGKHTGLFSVQLQPPGNGTEETLAKGEPATNEPATNEPTPAGVGEGQAS